MVILYVDLVGSTALSAIVSTEELSVLVTDLLSGNVYYYIKA